MKAYPLDIQVTCGDPIYYSKGHHEPVEFVHDGLAYYDYHFAEGDVYHAWWRYVPDATGEWNVVITVAKPHSRGAFPVTCCDREVLQ